MSTFPPVSPSAPPNADIVPPAIVSVLPAAAEIGALPVSYVASTVRLLAIRTQSTPADRTSFVVEPETTKVWLFVNTTVSFAKSYLQPLQPSSTSGSPSMYRPDSQTRATAGAELTSTTYMTPPMRK